MAAAAYAFPTVGLDRRLEPLGLSVRDTFIDKYTILNIARYLTLFGLNYGCGRGCKDGSI